MAPKKPPAKAKPKAKATAAVGTQPLRRSARVAAQDAGARAPDGVAAPARVVKKAPPKKKTPPAKKAAPAKVAPKKAATKKTTAKKGRAKAAAPELEEEEDSGVIVVVQETTKKKPAAKKTSKTPAKKAAPKKTARTATKEGQSTSTRRAPEPTGNPVLGIATEGAAPPPPKRGRPRKGAAASPSPAASTRSAGVVKSTRGSKKKVAKKPEVAAPHDDEDWTDSPAKTSPKKNPSKVSTKGRATVNEVLESQDEDRGGRAGSIGGIRKSIERSDSRTRRDRSASRARSRSRATSKSPARGGKKAKKSDGARTGSAASPNRSMRTRSQSPAKERKGDPAAHKVAGTADEFLANLGKELGRSKRPAKDRSPSPKRGRRSSPAKFTKRAGSVASGRSPSLGVGTSRSSSKQSGGSRSDSLPPIDEATKAEFDYAFAADDDEYGQALRRVEADAYRCEKAGIVSKHSEAELDLDDEIYARALGVRRARLEAGLRTVGNPKKPPVTKSAASKTKEGAGEKAAAKMKRGDDKEDGDGTGGRLTLGPPKRARKGSVFQPTEDEDDDDDDDEDDGDGFDPRGSRPPQPSGKRRRRNSTYQPREDEDEEDEDDIVFRTGRQPPSGGNRGKTDRSYRATKEDDDDDNDLEQDERPPRKSPPTRKSPATGSAATKGAAKTRKRSPATIRRKGWLGGRSPSPAGDALPPPRSKKTVSSKRRASSPVKKPTRSQSTRQPPASAQRGRDGLLPPGQPSHPGRGAIRSATNPEILESGRMNPLFETMPGPEIWHREMPPQFPYGETPFIRQQMSRQINEDLARGRENGQEGAEESSSFFGRISSAVRTSVSAVGQTFFGSPSRDRPPAWELPEITNEEVEEAMRELSRNHRSPSRTSGGRKRKTPSEDGRASPRKRARSRSAGSRR